MNRNPILYQGRGFHLVWFGFFAAAGGGCGLFVFAAHLQSRGFALGAQEAWVFPALALVCWLSARLAHFIALGKKFFEAPDRHLFETAFYVQGGIFGLFVFSAFIADRIGVPLLIFWDGLALGGLAALILGRLGCFNYGCCHGRPTGRRWGAVYDHPQSKVIRLKPEWAGVPLHPAPLYAAGLNAAAFAAALGAAGKNLSGGTLASLFLIYHGAARIFLDRFRDLRNWRGGVTGRPPATASWSCVALGAGLWLFSSLFSAAAPRFAEPLPLPWEIVGAIAGASALLFLGYGLHGKKVGSFFEVSPAEKSWAAASDAGLSPGKEAQK